MYFEHTDLMWAGFPELAAGVIFATGITPDADSGPRAAHYSAIAGERLASGTEAELPEIQAWRRTFSRMGLKPTQYRCASESLLRRFRKERALPRIHPLIDLCNAVSLAYAIPVAVFDVAQVSQGIQVRHATGEERYLTFSGEIEHPEPDEVVFADADEQAERALGRTGADRRGADRRRGAARHGAGGRARAHRRAGGGAGRAVGGQAGGRGAQPVVPAIRLPGLTAPTMRRASTT
jgi:DNA/RNA-binding domain of Phe-tRNA-synthetase-like protein